MINESQPVKTEEENEFKLKENQERFFSAKRDHIQKCLEHEDSENLAKTATFLLNQLESAQKANESLKEKIKYIKEQHEVEIQKLYGELSYFKQKAPQHLNPEVAELVEKGYNIRTAYRIVNNRNRKQARAKTEFDYDTETPKGEWV